MLKGIALGLVCFFLFIILPMLGLAYTANSTVVNPQFAAAEVQKLDIASFGHDIINDLIPAEDKPYAPAIDATMVEMKPWIDRQITTAVNGAYAYLNGESDSIKIVIQPDPFKQSLVNNFTAAFQKSPPAEYLKLSATQKTQYLSQSQKKLADSLPLSSSLTITSEDIGTDGMNALDRAKEVFGYIHTSFIWLMALAVVLILLVILIFREIKGASRTIGIVFLAGGALSYGIYWGLNHFVPGMISTGDFPDQIQAWVPQFVSDILSPWGIFSLAVLIIGAVLVGISFLYRSGKGATE
jgi:lipopolysaccharide export LptBFGC system permease protein LptF